MYPLINRKAELNLLRQILREPRYTFLGHIHKQANIKTIEDQIKHKNIKFRGLLSFSPGSYLGYNINFMFLEKVSKFLWFSFNAICIHDAKVNVFFFVNLLLGLLFIIIKEIFQLFLILKHLLLLTLLIR